MLVKEHTLFLIFNWFLFSICVFIYWWSVVSVFEWSVVSVRNEWVRLPERCCPLPDSSQNAFALYRGKRREAKPLRFGVKERVISVGPTPLAFIMLLYSYIYIYILYMYSDFSLTPGNDNLVYCFWLEK